MINVLTKSVLKKILIVIGISLLLFVVFILGARFSTVEISNGLEMYEAEMSLYRLEKYMDLEDNLITGCEARAKSKLEVLVDVDKGKLARYIQRSNNTEVVNYLNETPDKDLVEELKSYEINKHRSWKHPRCTEKDI